MSTESCTALTTAEPGLWCKLLLHIYFAALLRFGKAAGMAHGHGGRPAPMRLAGMGLPWRKTVVITGP